MKRNKVGTMAARSFGKAAVIRGGQPRSEPPFVVRRHTEIRDNLVRKICKDLGIPFVR